MAELKTNIILHNDALSGLKTLPSNSIDCCVTSPPYWGLRVYDTECIDWSDGWTGELGLEPDYNQYINHLCSIFDQVYRVLKPEGTCWVNIGDTYSGRNRECNVPAKSLVMIPFRFAIGMVDHGWILRNTIIWHKPSPVPSSAKDRFTVDFEYLFFFVKTNKYYFEQQFRPFAETSIKRVERFIQNGETYNPMRHKTDINRKTQSPFEILANSSKMDMAKGRNMRTTWTINSASYSEAHFAVFPEKLIEHPIKAGCPKGGIVLDPFMGSGTTGVIAKKLFRQFIGIELNPEYVELANERIAKIIPQTTLDSFNIDNTD